MKSIISVNKKFMKIAANILIDLILKSKYTKGIEIYIDYLDKDEMHYFEELVVLCKKNNLIFQVHAEATLDIERQLEYMKYLENVSDMLNMKIVVTIHSIYDKDINVSINKTIEYLNKLINSIENNKLIICLENLNTIPNTNRLNRNQIIPIVYNNEKVYMTYDIGHEIADIGDIIDLNESLVQLIRNVHVHTVDNTSEFDCDHKPIYKMDKNSKKVLKALSFLLDNKYDYNIVFEYDVYKCGGESTEDKVTDYLASIDYLSEKINYMVKI